MPPKWLLSGLTIVVSRRNGFSACHMMKLNSGISTRLSQAGRTAPGVEQDPEHRDRHAGADAEDDRVHDRRGNGLAQPGDQAA